MKTRKLRLKSIVKSHKSEKKYDAIFLNSNGKEKRVPFGQKGYNDFILYNKKLGNKTAKEHKKRYLKRHSGMGEHWNKPDTPGALSKWVLWNKPSFRASVSDFKKRFDL
jgi:hypothetical protein